MTELFSLRSLVPLLSVLCLWVASAPARADFNDGVSAFMSGDYETARRHLEPLAETADHGLSMYFIGMMYMQGRGVRQDTEQAGEWMLRAARQRVSQAQFKLGGMYMRGDGLAQDYESAYAWLSTAILHGQAAARQVLEVVRGKLNKEELREAKRLAEQFSRDYGPEEESQPGAAR